MEISQFNDVVCIVAISMPAMFLGAIVLLWVLERSVFKYQHCELCKELIEREYKKFKGNAH